MASALIETEGLTRKFGGLTAVDGLDLKVEEGEVFGFLGPNGAGKTTTVRMLSCLISKTGGKARVGGYDTDDSSASLKIRKLIGLLPENVGLYEELSVFANLDFYGKLYEMPVRERQERIEYFLRLLGLSERRNSPAATLSKGMKQKLAIARALIHNPQVVFLDEPTANLDPESAKTVRDFILELKKERRTIFLNTHNLDEAQRICDRIGIMKTRLLTVGTPDRLKSSLRGTKTVVQVAAATEKVTSAAARIYPGVEAQGNRLIFSVSDPAEENPKIIDSLVAAGARVQFVTELSPSLEEVYLKTVEGTT